MTGAANEGIDTSQNGVKKKALQMKKSFVFDCYLRRRKDERSYTGRLQVNGDGYAGCRDCGGGEDGGG